MKTKLVLLIATAGALTFTSCKRCVQCQKNGSVSTTELCKPSETKRSTWNNFIKDYEEYNDATCR